MPGSKGGYVLRIGLIGFAARMQSRDPTPSQRVRSSVAVQQMPEKEIRAQPPWQAKGKNPDRSEPHPRVIVQIACVHQFGGPGVKTLQPGLTTHRPVHIAAQAAVTVKGGKIGVQPRCVAAPNLRTPFEPAFEVAAPDDLLHEFLGVLGAVGCKGCRHSILFQHQPAPDVG